MKCGAEKNHLPFEHTLTEQIIGLKGIEITSHIYSHIYINPMKCEMKVSLTHEELWTVRKWKPVISNVSLNMMFPFRLLLVAFLRLTEDFWMDVLINGSDLWFKWFFSFNIRHISECRTATSSSSLSSYNMLPKLALLDLSRSKRMTTPWYHFISAFQNTDTFVECFILNKHPLSSTFFEIYLTILTFLWLVPFEIDIQFIGNVILSAVCNSKSLWEEMRISSSSLIFSEPINSGDEVKSFFDDITI